MTLQDVIKKKRFTILLGKNGSGKSTALRRLDSSVDVNTKYVTPERGGSLKPDPNLENNINNNEGWLAEVMRKNRFEKFREQSAYQFRNLETLVLREIEKDVQLRSDTSYTFDTTLNQINELLPAVQMLRSDHGFTVHSKLGDKVPEESLSSGESELIALGIEVLVFAKSSDEDKYLLLDEPDVHLHPDLQQKFIQFVEATATKHNFGVVIATHSTAVVGAFSDKGEIQIVPVASKNQDSFDSFNYDPICHEILPIFGSHPLSSQFNKRPVLLVEGEDDKRVVDQIVRTSRGAITLSPCVVGTVSQMNKWETWLNSFLPSIYDDPVAYSLRDLDSSTSTVIEDVGIVRRAKLNCYAIENLLLTEECLDEHGYTEQSYLNELRSWGESHPTHQVNNDIISIVAAFDKRRTLNMKRARNVLVALLGATKPWEVVVGQLLAKHVDLVARSPHSLRKYLGDGAIRVLFG